MTDDKLKAAADELQRHIDEMASFGAMTAADMGYIEGLCSAMEIVKKHLNDNEDERKGGEG